LALVTADMVIVPVYFFGHSLLLEVVCARIVTSVF